MMSTKPMYCGWRTRAYAPVMRLATLPPAVPSAGSEIGNAREQPFLASSVRQQELPHAQIVAREPGAAHEKGTAHEWTAEEARNAGRKGGQISRGGRGRLMIPQAPADGTIPGSVPPVMGPGRAS